MNTLTGTCIEIGIDKQGIGRVIVEVDAEALKALVPNILYKEVCVELSPIQPNEQTTPIPERP